MGRLIATLLTPAALLAASAAAAAPDVVVSIKPLHSLVAGVMRGVGEPGLIVDGAASAHTFSLKPSTARALQAADLVFWVGPTFEAFLVKPIGALSDKVTVASIDDAPGVQKLAFREGGPFDADEHEVHAADGAPEKGSPPGHSGHGHGEDAAETAVDGGVQVSDMHVWLDPVNAKALVAYIQATLAKADPANASIYKANAQGVNNRIDALDAEIQLTVAPVKDRPFVVFHDAYQYFEKRYGMTVAGSITVSPETLPGAERISNIHRKVRDLGATCIFAEPQFEPKLVKVIAEGTKARSGTLDPEAGTLTAGPDLYFELMRGLAVSMRECLSDGN